MPAGELQQPFAKLCRESGIELVADPRIPGLTNRGHFDLEPDTPQAKDAVARLQRIFSGLGGSEEAASAKRTSPIRPDFVLSATGHIVELDEVQHFTSWRLSTCDHYDGLDLPWMVDDYRKFCQTHHREADRYRKAKETVDFTGEYGRQRQRAYLDAVRDILVPVVSECPGVIRVAVPERNLELGLSRLTAQLERIDK